MCYNITKCVVEVLMRLNISRTKNAASFYVIETVYEGKKERSVTVEKLGTEKALREKLGDIDIEQWARDYVAELNRKAKEGKEPAIIEKYSPSKLIEKDVKHCFNGGYLFLQSIYRDLNIDKLCNSISKKHKFKYNLDSILSRLIFSRILFPASKLATYELSKKFIEQPDFDLQHIYRALDVISKESDHIQAELYKNSLKLCSRNSKVLYYDCTNFFFELEEEDGIKQYGYSKEHRPNPIVQMGLFMDGDGMPLAFSITPGNQNEQTTLKPLEKKILADFELSQFVVCTDAGLASTANRKFNDIVGRAFITTQSIKKLKTHLKEWALDPTGWSKLGSSNKYDIRDINESNQEDDLYYKERWINENGLEQRLIVSFSSKYKYYQKQLRLKQVDRAMLLMKKNPKKVTTTKPNDSKRFINQLKTTKDGEVAENTSLFIDTDLIETEAMYDGFYAVCTNLEDSAEKIIEVNHRRWQIEECFRILKSEFKARPVFLQREDRIKAHFLVCFMALLLFKLLEKKLDYKYTCREITSELSNMNFHHNKRSNTFLPSYTRSDFTDNLHSIFGFRTDYEVITRKKLKEIIKITKK